MVSMTGWQNSDQYNQLQVESFENDFMTVNEQEETFHYPKEKIVYLSADAKETLTELKPDELYIIGGIVDRNRYKNLTFDKASRLNIRTAKQMKN